MDASTSDELVRFRWERHARCSAGGVTGAHAPNCCNQISRQSYS
jgi:hypothetical protein